MKKKFIPEYLPKSFLVFVAAFFVGCVGVALGFIANYFGVRQLAYLAFGIVALSVVVGGLAIAWYWGRMIKHGFGPEEDNGLRKLGIRRPWLIRALVFVAGAILIWLVVPWLFQILKSIFRMLNQ